MYRYDSRTYSSLQGPFHSFFPQGFLNFNILRSPAPRPSSEDSPDDMLICSIHSDIIHVDIVLHQKTEVQITAEMPLFHETSDY